MLPQHRQSSDRRSMTDLGKKKQNWKVERKRGGNLGRGRLIKRNHLEKTQELAAHIAHTGRLKKAATGKRKVLDSCAQFVRAEGKERPSVI